MNPLDNQELLHLHNVMKKDMPQHFDNGVQIKRSFSQGLPKNAMEFSTKVNNKFLNDNLAIIEEMEYRDSSNIIPKLFKSYQNKIYGKTEILNHDNFFHADLATGTPMGNDNFKHYPFIINSYRFPVPAVDGAELNFGLNGTTADSTGGNVLAIYSDNAVTATPTELYDQIAFNARITSNFVLGCYDDTGSDEANNLLGATGSVSLSGGSFGYNSVTEFGMTTARFYLAYNYDNGASGGYYKSSPTIAGINQNKAQSFTSLPNPAGAISGFSTYTNQSQRSKISHS